MELTRGLGTGGDLAPGRAGRCARARSRCAARCAAATWSSSRPARAAAPAPAARPLVAKIAREMGALTVAVVTRPFGFEGSRRTRDRRARASTRLQGAADTVIVIPNDRLMAVLERGTSMVDAFKVCDDLLRQGVQGICDLITLPGPDQPRLRRRPHDHPRRRAPPCSGIGYAGGGNRATEAAHGRHRLPAARDADRRRQGHPARRHRRPRPVAGRGQRGRPGRRRRRRPRARTSSSAPPSTPTSRARSGSPSSRPTSAACAPARAAARAAAKPAPAAPARPRARRRPVAGPRRAGHALRPALPGAAHGARRRETVPEPETPPRLRPRVGRPPPPDPDATTVIRRSDLGDAGDGPEDAA